MTKLENKPVEHATAVAALENPLPAPRPSKVRPAAPRIDAGVKPLEVARRIEPKVGMIAEQTLLAPAPVSAPAERAIPVSKPAADKPTSPVETAPSSTHPATHNSVVNLMTNPSFKGFDDFTTFGQANIDALVQASAVYTKGVEEFSKEIASLARTSLETGAAAARAAFAAKTVKDVVEVHADFTKTSLEKLVANWARFGELGVKLATDTASPLTARANAVASLVASPSR
jgi:phasin family protein